MSDSIPTLIQLPPLPIESLPQHPDIKSDSQLALDTFLLGLFDQADDFVSSIDSSTSKWHKNPKDKITKVTYPGLRETQNISINQYSQTIQIDERSEHWFARRTKHSDRSEVDAKYDEFLFALKTDHCEHESEYTPNITQSAQTLKYEGLHGRTFGSWGDVTLEIREIVHKTSPVTSPRQFSVLVATASKNDTGFIVVQKPLYVASPEQNSAILPSASGSSKAVVGKYVSIERVSLDTATSSIDWYTCTASDAGGWIPMKMQKMSLPGVLAKDVGMVLEWIGKQRLRSAGHDA